MHFLVRGCLFLGACLAPQTVCLDSIENCKKPVTYVGKKDGCYTFACEHGTKNEHLIHTMSHADVAALFVLQKENPGPEKPEKIPKKPEIEPVAGDADIKPENKVKPEKIPDKPKKEAKPEKPPLPPNPEKMPPSR